MLLLGGVLSAADALWTRAVESYRHSQNWVPFEYEVEQRQVNGRGTVVSHSLTESRLVSDGNGNWQNEVVSEQFLVGDADSRSPFGSQDEPESDEDSGGRFAAVSAHPLDPAMQDRVTVSRVGQGRPLTEGPDGSATVAYRYVVEPTGDSRAEGTIWLQADTGFPVRLEKRVDPPIMPIKSFTVEHTYEPRDEYWISTDMSFAVTGRLFFVERHVEMNLDLHDHRYHPEAAAALQMGPGR